MLLHSATQLPDVEQSYAPRPASARAIFASQHPDGHADVERLAAGQERHGVMCRCLLLATEAIVCGISTIRGRPMRTQFGREAACAHARDDSLGHADGFAVIATRQVSADIGIRRHGMAGGYPRLFAVRHVQHDRLRAFEQHARALCHALCEVAGIRYDVIPEQRPCRAHGLQCGGIQRIATARSSHRHLPECGPAVLYQVPQLERRAFDAAGP